MYIHEAIPQLLQTLLAVTHASSEVLIAHGRNRQAEATFLHACHRGFAVDEVPIEELDPVYQCSDVSVLRLKQSLDAG